VALRSGKRGNRSAKEEAVRLLARRPLARRELLHKLTGAGYGEAESEEAVGSLQEDGYLDDAELALHYITVRAERMGHGRSRLLMELERRGVDPATAEKAWDRAVDSGAVDPDLLLRRAVKKRLETLSGDPDRRSLARVYNALLRSGFEPQAVRGALEPYFSGSGEPAGGFDDEVT
jgi:regulatory protein